MGNNKSNPNIEWKKPGFDAEERITRKVDIEKAIEHEAKDTKNVQKAYTPSPKSLPEGLNKIRKKIREAFDDEDEDEDNYQIVTAPIDTENSLINALNDEEKKILKQQDAQQQSKLLDDAAKLTALKKVNQFINETKIQKPSTKDILTQLQSGDTTDKSLAINSIKKTIQKETGIKIKGKITDKDLNKISKGIKKIKKMGAGKHLEGMRIKDVIKIAEFSEKNAKDAEVAKMILEKSGRKDIPKKIEKETKELKLSKKDRKYVEEKLSQKRKKTR